MTQKLFAHKSKTMRRLSILLSFLLLCNCVISSNVTTQAESEVMVEAAEISGTDGAASAGTGTDATAEGAETSGVDTTGTTVIVAGDDDLTTEPDTDEPTDDTLTESVPDGVILTGTYGDITVTVEAAEDAFTEEVSVNVSAADEDAFEAAVLEACADIYPADTYTVIDVAAVNISFLTASGAEVEPASEVKVTISGLELATESTDEDETTHTANYALIFHMDDEGNMEWIDEMEAGAESYEFTASEFSDYGIATVEVTAEAVEENGPNPSPSPSPDPSAGGSSTKTIKVYYDRIVVNSSGNKSSITAQNDSQGIKSVTISGGSATNNGTVAHENGKATSWSATTTSLTYTNTSTDTVTLTVEPADGYYITYITICCTGPNSNAMPTSCTTWGDGDAYNSTYSVSSTGTISVSVNLNQEKGFKHDSGSSIYFVLIATAPIPSPLYVEYDYGDIVSYIGASSYASDTSAFSTADGWTTVSDKGNYYGPDYDTTDVDGEQGVKTAYTQYKYAYSGTASASEAANWKHYANTITDTAKAQAAAAGYVFAGWKAVYYTSVTVSANNDRDQSGYQDNYNSWDYTSWTGSYGTATYSEDEQVTLTTNVRLIAQWVPIGIQIEKTVEGLSSGATSSYTIELQKSDGSSWTTVDSAYTASITGNGTSKNDTVYLIASGTYQVAETSAPPTIEYGGTTYYLTSTSGESLDIGVPTSSDYTIKTVTINGTDTEVAVLNDALTYTNVYSTSYIKVVKVFEGLDSSSDIPSDFSVTVSNGSEYNLTYNNSYFTSIKIFK